MHMFYPVWSIVPRVDDSNETESHLGLLDSIVRSAGRLCEGELVGRKFSALRFLYKIYH